MSAFRKWNNLKGELDNFYIVVSDAPKNNIIWTEPAYSYVIDSFISEILKYKLSVIQSLTEEPKAVLFTPPKNIHS